MKEIDEEKHKLLVLWAAECAENVLSYSVKASDNQEAEREWQLQKLSDSLKPVLQDLMR
jgi:hypothetical protein